MGIKKKKHINSSTFQIELVVINGREVTYLERKNSLTVKRSFLKSHGFKPELNRSGGRSSLFNWLLKDDLLTVSKILRVINKNEGKS